MAYLIFRNQRIDLLRGVAILLVLVLHFNIAYHLPQSALNRVFSENFINAVARNGNYGVTIFFVISGFLITLISIERYVELGKMNAFSFYTLRLARLLPCLLLVLIMIALFNLTPFQRFANKPNTVSLSLAIFSILTFWHNVLMEKAGYFNYCLNIYWSLSVEEVFYLAFPIVCMTLKKSRLLIVVLFALIIVAPICRSIYANNEIVALYGYFSCFDAIAFGCCAALITINIELKQLHARLLQYIAVLCIIIVYFYSGIMQNVVFGISFIAISTAVFLIMASQITYDSKKTSDFFIKGIAWFGKNSYELYLFHIIVLAIMREFYSADALGDYGKLIWLIIFLSMSALVSGTIAKFYSKLMNRRLRELLLHSSPNQSNISIKP